MSFSHYFLLVSDHWFGERGLWWRQSFKGGFNINFTTRHWQYVLPCSTICTFVPHNMYYCHRQHVLSSSRWGYHVPSPLLHYFLLFRRGDGGEAVLFWDGTRRHPIRPSVVEQRVHSAWEGEKVATTVREAWNCRPIATIVTDAIQGATGEVAITRSREIDSSSFTAACPEFMTKVILVGLLIVCTVNIKIW